MGLLKHFRSKSRLKEISAPQAFDYTDHPPVPSTPARFGRDHTPRLHDKLWKRIFTLVCPHVADRSYLPSEESQIGDGCMLCDLRDVAACAQVNRRWYGMAQRMLYTSVRIDAVHYCALEEQLAERRKKGGKHWRQKSSTAVEPVDVPNIRLQLLARTVRINPQLGATVLLLKLPYMTRETAKGDLARTVSALPHLQYVDLPDGFFNGDPSCLPLVQELQARCPDIRKMTYRAGAEDALELLAQRHWQSIEILELSALAIEPNTLRIVLASLPTLHELTLADMPWLDDTIFQSSPGQLPDFPPLQALKLITTPNLTPKALKIYLEAPTNRSHLISLTLGNTGIPVQDLSQVLWAASSLLHLSITTTVSKSLALTTHDLPPLTSISLKTLHFEISSSEDVHGLQKPAESYYAYLASSLHQNALPALETLYVRDQTFPDLLLMPEIVPAMPSIPRSYINHGSSPLKPAPVAKPPPAPGPGPAGGKGFTQTLSVFSKGLDELEWVVTSIAPPPTYPSASSSNNNNSLQPPRPFSSAARPLSAYSAARGLGPQWAQGGFGGEARKSVIVGNGFGGFLAIPQEAAVRPASAGGVAGFGRRFDDGFGLRPPQPGFAGAERRERRGSKHDLWR